LKQKPKALSSGVPPQGRLHRKPWKPAKPARFVPYKPAQRTKIGALGVAVFDCLVSAINPSVLVGRVEFGSPSSYRVKKVKREVGELVGVG